jgi:hypothetical protein
MFPKALMAWLLQSVPSLVRVVCPLFSAVLPLLRSSPHRRHHHSASDPRPRPCSAAISSSQCSYYDPTAHRPRPVSSSDCASTNYPSSAAVAANPSAPAPVNAAATAHKPHCGCITPKLAAVVDTSEPLPSDALQYSNGSRERNQAAEACSFNTVNGGRLAGTYEGPKSIANALAGGSKAEKDV